MSIGLVQSKRDGEMIEICGHKGIGKGKRWPYLLGVAHWDTIVEAAEGKLLVDCDFKEMIECVFICESEWQQVCSDLVDAHEKIEGLQRDLELAVTV